ncbi:MAG TPA: DNA-binding protein [Phycisphaerae bacterium]|nr:DNA-binding protein [Phycisphaerae bacterium]
MERNEGVIVVSDAGPVIHLDELDCLDLFRGFHSVVVPREVWAEVLRNRPGIILSAIPNGVVNDAPVDCSPQLAVLSDSLALDAGERAALRLMEQQADAVFLTDDAAARLAAESLNLRVHGTLGIIIRSVRVMLRSREEVLGILNSLPRRSTLYVSAELLGEVIARVSSAE